MEADAVRQWRKATRLQLQEARTALPAAYHQQCSRRVVARLIQLSLPTRAVVGFYSAIRGELDVQPFAERHILQGGSAALPRVPAQLLGTDPVQPLEFRLWTPGCPMAAGAYGIAYPEQGLAVLPEVLLIPLLGFDRDGYRLGFGGGYYDRTLSNPRLRPLTVGIGLSLSALETIHPQPHDVPLDIIVTEAATVVHRKA